MVDAGEDGSCGRRPLSKQHWRLPVDAIPPEGVNLHRVATPKEEDEIALALGLQSCSGVVLIARADQPARGEYALTGKLQANVVQICVVTLEPFNLAIDEPVSQEFWPPSKIAAVQSDEINPVSEDPPEPFVDDAIDLGALVYELLALAIDPYPKAPGVEFVEVETDDVQSKTRASEHPFAALQVLKDDK